MTNREDGPLRIGATMKCGPHHIFPWKPLQHGLGSGHSGERTAERPGERTLATQRTRTRTHARIAGWGLTRHRFMD
jgi:hypothetical protein